MKLITFAEPGADPWRSSSWRGGVLLPGERTSSTSPARLPCPARRRRRAVPTSSSTGSISSGRGSAGAAARSRHVERIGAGRRVRASGVTRPLDGVVVLAPVPRPGDRLRGAQRRDPRTRGEDGGACRAVLERPARVGGQGRPEGRPRPLRRLRRRGPVRPGRRPPGAAPDPRRARCRHTFELPPGDHGYDFVRARLEKSLRFLGEALKP